MVILSPAEGRANGSSLDNSDSLGGIDGGNESFGLAGVRQRRRWRNDGDCHRNLRLDLHGRNTIAAGGYQEVIFLPLAQAGRACDGYLLALLIVSVTVVRG